LRKLPIPALDWVPVLLDQKHALVVTGDDQGVVELLHHAVDARRPVRPLDPIFPDPHPAVAVHDPRSRGLDLHTDLGLVPELRKPRHRPKELSKLGGQERPSQTRLVEDLIMQTPNSVDTAMVYRLLSALHTSGRGCYGPYSLGLHRRPRTSRQVSRLVLDPGRVLKIWSMDSGVRARESAPAMPVEAVISLPFTVSSDYTDQSWL